MDRENSLPRRNIPRLSEENTDTATPRDRIGRDLRNRMFREDDGIFTDESTPAMQRYKDTPTRPQNIPPQRQNSGSPVTRRRLLRQIQNYSLALAQAAMYADTHPHDRGALNYYNQYLTRLTDAVKMYENRYGTLSALPTDF